MIIETMWIPGTANSSPKMIRFCRAPGPYASAAEASSASAAAEVALKAAELRQAIDTYWAQMEIAA